MSDRRPLTQGVRTPIDTDIAREFVYAGKTSEPTKPEPTKTPTPATPTVAVNRVPISTRIRDDLAKALKRASLERQLEGVEPSTLQDMLEQAIEPWLREHGYLE